MARFKAVDNNESFHQTKTSNYPFKNIYGCVEGDMVYINMEAVEGLQKGMVTQRDMYVLVDMSGSMMGPFGKLFKLVKEPSFFEMTKYKAMGYVSEQRIDGKTYRSWSNEALIELERKGYVKFYKNEIKDMITTVIDSIAPFDDDGVDVFFFSDGLVHKGCVASASEVSELIEEAINKPNAFKGTMPLDCFQSIANQIKSKGRPGTVFFLTDGAMDDGGEGLKRFYINTLHKDFRTRDMFYCYSIEFGKEAEGCLEVLDGLFAPEQGPEDLFDVESADNLERITNVLKQVGGMSAIGSEELVNANIVSGNAKIDMVNADLIDNGISSISGPINQVMSFRVRTKEPFTMSLDVKGYENMKIKVMPSGYDVEVAVD